MCVHRQQPVCLSTFTTKSVLRACLHVRTFLHCLRSLHVRTCQSSTQSLCGVHNNLNISCHNSHHLYWHVTHVSISFNIFRVQVLCLCTFTSKSNHLWTCVPSTFQLMHGYMSIINTMLVENNLNVCTRQHWLQRIIIMCVRRQQPVCLSTFTTVSCVHAYMYVHFFIAFDPCMCAHVNRQPKPCAVLTITSILAVTIHIACIGMYIHVSISFNPSQHISCTIFMSMHISTRVKSSMDIYVHVSICALDLSTNARVHVNRQHYALSTIT